MTISNDPSQRPKKEHETDSRSRALLIAEAAQLKHAERIIIFQVGKLTSLADFFVICSAESQPQIRAISEFVDAVLSKEGTKPIGIEGREGGVWVLMDYGDVIFHVFKEEARQFYGLDRFWGDAPQISLAQIAQDADTAEEETG